MPCIKSLTTLSEFTKLSGGSIPNITIQGTPIDFPDTGQSPLWSGAIIQFALAVELALSGLTSAGDLGKQNFPLTGAYNPVTNLNISGLTFDPNTVRAAFIRYYVFRTTTTVTVAEAGTLTLVYNATNSVGNKWEMNRQYVGDAEVSFTILDTGQIQVTTTTIGGASHTGTFGYTAQVLAQ